LSRCGWEGKAPAAAGRSETAPRGIFENIIKLLEVQGYISKAFRGIDILLVFSVKYKEIEVKRYV
jgi:hypothetical protein